MRAIGITTIMTIILLCGCNLFGPDDEIDPFANVGSDSAAGWLAVTASIGQRDPQVYLVDYNDPTIYRRIGDSTHGNWSPVFSPSRTMLLYSEGSSGTFNPLLVLYDFIHDTYLPLSDSARARQYPESFYAITGTTPVVFTSAETGFYYRTISHMIFVSSSSYYDLTHSLRTSFGLHPRTQRHEFVVGRIGADTLIAYAGDWSSTSSSGGYYFTDSAGSYLAPINNPHLITYGFAVAWNENLRLFAQSEPVGPDRYRITVTNLNGTYYHAFTSGEDVDIAPSWGPGDAVILFSSAGRIMKVDVRTEVIELVVDPAAIDGASLLQHANY